MPSTMSWPSKAVAVMPSRAAREASRALVASLMRNDVLAAMSNLPHTRLYRDVALMSYAAGSEEQSVTVRPVTFRRGRRVVEALRLRVVERLVSHPRSDVPAGEQPSIAARQAPCKTVGLAYPGSNPGPATSTKNSPGPALTRFGADLVACGWMRLRAPVCGSLCQIRAKVWRLGC